MSSKNEYKGCEMLNSPTHKHLDELVDIFSVFAEWKEESGNNKEAFIPWQSYQDLAWLIFGMIGKAQMYLKEDKSRTMVQRREGTDDCEHEFAGIKGRNTRPSALDARQYTAKRSGHRSAHWFKRRAKNNSAGINKIHRDVIMTKLEKKTSLRKRRA